MMDLVRSAVDDRDLLLFVADALREPDEEDARATSILERADTPAFLVLNKVDRVANKPTLLKRIEQYKALHDFVEYFPVSALTGDGLETLKKCIVERLPESEAFFPPEYITDQPERFLVAELIREKILELARQEVPHAVAVLVEQWEDTGRLTRISATIHVERDGQKAILIGAGGTMLKQIGTAARTEAEHLLGRKIHLELFVKVRPNWREDPQFLNEIDWRSMAGL
jgi:GTP-binding protein Era